MFPLSIKTLESYLPHRPPMIWIDQVDWVEENGGECTVTFDSKAAYCVDGKLVQGAFIEWMAQASGYCHAARAYKKAPGDVRKMAQTYLVGLRETILHSGETLKDGDVIKVRIELVRDLAPLALIKGTITKEGHLLAQGTLKVFFTQTD